MITRHSWDGAEVITMENEAMIVSLLPSHGNNLYRIYDKTAGREVLRIPASIRQLEESPGHFGTPLMMPPSRIANGRFRFQGRDYQFEINTPNGHHLHGFLRSRPWKIVETAEENGVASVTSVFSAADFPEVMRQYPHPLVIEVTYRLAGNQLIHHATARNEGTETAPFGYGLHTWFMLDGRPEEWELILPAESVWELDEDLLPTGKRLPLGALEGLKTGLNLQGQDLDIPLFIGNHKREAVLKSARTELRYEASERFKHWVIYTMGQADQYICLEPYTWVPNAPNLNEDADVTGLIGIEPGESVELEVTLEINAP